MEEKRCGTCLYDCQHDVCLSDERYVLADCGHCTKPRLKKRVYFDAACTYWEEKQSAITE